jgi:hypothetical protein
MDRTPILLVNVDNPRDRRRGLRVMGDGDGPQRADVFDMAGQTLPYVDGAYVHPPTGKRYRVE